MVFLRDGLGLTGGPLNLALSDVNGIAPIAVTMPPPSIAGFQAKVQAVFTDVNAIYGYRLTHAFPLP